MSENRGNSARLFSINGVFSPHIVKAVAQAKIGPNFVFFCIFFTCHSIQQSIITLAKHKGCEGVSRSLAEARRLEIFSKQKHSLQKHLFDTSDIQESMFDDILLNDSIKAGEYEQSSQD